jgi:hypothetical protein
VADYARRDVDSTNLVSPPVFLLWVQLVARLLPTLHDARCLLIYLLTSGAQH